MPALGSHLERIRRSALVQNAGWVFVGQGANFVLQAGCFLLLARLLGVTEYGVFAGAFALVNSLTPYSSLGSAMIFMRYVSADRGLASVYWGNSLVITLGTCVVLAPVLTLVAFKLFGPGSVMLVVVLVAASCLMSQIVNNASTVFQTFEQLKATALLRALSNLLRLLAIGALLLSVHRGTALQCAIGILASTMVAAGFAMIWVKRDVGKTRISGKLIRSRFWEGIGFSFAGSTQAVYNDVDKIMLSHYGMNAANGIYTMAYRIVDFATTPVTAIDTAVLPRYFNLSRQGVPAVSRMAAKIVPIAVLTGLGAAGFTLLTSPLLVRLVGHGFSDTLVAVRWLCWLPALRGVHQLTGGVLTASGQQNYRTAAQFLVAVLNFALNLIWIPAHGWVGAAWASLISDGSLGAISILLTVLIVVPVNRNSCFDSSKVK